MSTSTHIETKSQEIRLVSRPSGKPSEVNFQLTTTTLPPIADGEFLVQNLWMSVDPYMRGRMRDGNSYVPAFEIDAPLDGGCVGKVIESRNELFAEGDYVLGSLGWREKWISDGTGVTKIDPVIAPVQTYLGTLGMPGLTAWVGLKRIAALKRESTVFVSAASGAVGSVACQIAKANDCKVIGSAGSQAKTDWLLNEAKIDAVINYKESPDIASALADVSPDGIDVYFDNVGGDHLEAAIEHLNDFGCIVACGMISVYNAENPVAAPRNLFKIVAKRLRMQGFICSDHFADRDEFLREMSAWIRSDRIKWNETVTVGLESAPAAFIGLFEGENLGKSLVQIAVDQ